MAKFASGEWAGETIQSLTERTGGSDLAELETTATPDGDAWRLNGFKWFASNANGQAWVVLAKPEGAPDSARGIATFLVLRERRDGTRNGIRIRRLKDKLGHAGRRVRRGRVRRRRGVPPVGRQATRRSDGGRRRQGPRPHDADDERCPARHRDDGSRVRPACVGRGALLRADAAGVRTAAGGTAADAAQAGRAHRRCRSCASARVRRLRSGTPPAHRRPAHQAPRGSRLGITAASDAIEVHGGNGYVENWPVARILRDAQVNPLWEGPDNILCLDVRRGIEREQADVAFLAPAARGPRQRPAGRSHDLVSSPSASTSSRSRSSAGRHSTARWPSCGCSRSPSSWSTCTPARCSSSRPATSSASSAPTASRSSLASTLRRHLADQGPLRGIDEPRSEELDRFKDLWDGALVDDRIT